MRVLDAICKWWLNRKKSTSTALVPVHVANGTWQRVLVAGSDITRSYKYTCKCLQLQELTLAEAKDGKIRKCGCGLKYSLLRDLALAPESTITEYEHALTTLPVHALAVRAPQQPYKVVEVGNDDVRVGEWGGKHDAARVRGFDVGDPGYTGLF